MSSVQWPDASPAAQPVAVDLEPASERHWGRSFLLFLLLLAIVAAAAYAAALYFEIKPGTGESPKATDTVKVHYHGTLRDGTVFDSSVDRGEPATFPLNRVIACWTEGVQKMKVGGKSKLICPASIAYGDRGAPPKIMPGAALVFEVELLGIEAPKPAGPPSGHP